MPSAVSLIQCEWNDQSVLLDQARVERVESSGANSRIHLRSANKALSVNRVTTAPSVRTEDVFDLPPALARYSPNVRGVVERDGTPYLLVEPGYFRDHVRATFTPRRVIHTPRSSKLDRVRLVLCDIPAPGSRRLVFGFSGKQIVEVSHRITVTPVPSAPDCVLGVAVWRNLSVPVVDLHAALGLGQSAVGLCNHTLFVRAVQTTDIIAIPIGASVRTMSSRQPVYQEPNPPSMPLELVRGVFRLDRGTLVIPDIDALI